MRQILVFLLLTMIAFPIACSRPFGLDESDIERVVEFYYSPGKQPLGPKKKYQFLSSKSRTQFTEEQWVKRLSSGSDKVDSVKVLRKKESSSDTYAIVSCEELGDTKRIRTPIWIFEDRKWRRLILPKTEEEVLKAFDNGDYPAAKAKAEEWLSLNPFSIDAYEMLAFSIMRSGIHPKSERSLNDIVRAVLAINENDSKALFLAVCITENIEIAKTFLKRMEDHLSYTAAADNLARKISNPNERLSFLESQKNVPDLLILKLLTLGELERWEDFKKLSNEKDTFTLIKKSLDTQDPSFAASSAGFLGLFAKLAGDRETAQKLLDYGVIRDPNNQAIKALAVDLSR